MSKIHRGGVYFLREKGKILMTDKTIERIRKFTEDVDWN